jgi:hypothetical protein
MAPRILNLDARYRWEQHAVAALCPGEEGSTPWIGGWLENRANLDILEKRKIFSPARKWTPDRPARSVRPITTELFRLLLGCYYTYFLLHVIGYEDFFCFFHKHHYTSASDLVPNRAQRRWFTQAVTFVYWIRNVSGSNLFRDTSYIVLDLTLLSSVPPRIYRENKLN